MRLVPPLGPALQRPLELAARGDQAVEAVGVELEQRDGGDHVDVGAGDGALDAVEAVGVEGVRGRLGPLGEEGGLGLDGAAEPPRGDRGTFDQDRTCVALWVPVMKPCLPFGLEFGGVLAGEDDVLGAEAVLEAVEFGCVLAGGRDGALGFRSVDPAGLLLCFGALHRRCPLFWLERRTTSRAEFSPKYHRNRGRNRSPGGRGSARARVWGRSVGMRRHPPVRASCPGSDGASPSRGRGSGRSVGMRRRPWGRASCPGSDGASPSRVFHVGGRRSAAGRCGHVGPAHPPP